MLADIARIGISRDSLADANRHVLSISEATPMAVMIGGGVVDGGRVITKTK